MKIWKYSRLDAAMLALSVVQFVVMLLTAVIWERLSLLGWAAAFMLLVVVTVYNIVVVSHLFTHTPWFNSPLLNRLVSMLNSVNMGQSVQAYQLSHVRNHHRYNNDQKGPDGKTRDSSSTFRDGVGSDHDGLLHYAVVGAVETLTSIGRALLSVTRLWRVSPHEQNLLPLFTKSAATRAWELRQVQLDRMVHFAAISLFLAISWKWFLLCYLPAFVLSLMLVNMQNYYEHYGAAPQNKYANSVSYYGRLYNLLTFNDGFHQEHHLRPRAHWTEMPRMRRAFAPRLDQVERIISPVPAMLGAFHRQRKQLHKRLPTAISAISLDSNTSSTTVTAG